MNRLSLLGFLPFFQEEFSELKRPDLIPGRVAVENKNNYLVLTENSELQCEISGSLLYTSETQSELPKVGDWVALAKFDDLGIIHFVLKRKTKLSRKVPDKKTSEQVLVTNIDKVFLMQSANENFNLNRLERQVAAVHNSGAEPIFVLSKIDLSENPTEFLEAASKRIVDIKIFPLSSQLNLGITELENFISRGTTYAMLGSSGVGKSTLINTLLGEDKLHTREIRNSDSRGKHATTRREMLILPNGGIIIDTPGLREFGLWEDSNGISRTYSEFEYYSDKCKYSDCTHTVETGCAVMEAVDSGNISRERYDNYLKLRKELNYLEGKIDQRKALEEKRKWKIIHKESKRIMHNGKKKL